MFEGVGRHMRCLVLAGCLIMCGNIFAAEAAVTLSMRDVRLSDAVRLLAGYFHLNVIISHSVQGTATFNFNHASPQEAFDTLLVAHGLSRWQIGNVWLIGRQDDLLKRRQAANKWHDLEESSSPLLVHIWQLRYAQARMVAGLMSEGQHMLLSGRGYVRADDRTNQLYMEDTQEKITQAAALIRRMDIPVRQVLVNARIVSIDSAAERALGFDFSVRPAGQANGSSEGAGKYSLAIVRLADGSELDVKLAALENAGQAELISSPSLFAANQQTASIESGEEVPYQEVSESGGTAIAFKKAVLGLKVTPQVLPGNKILLQLQINQDRPDNKLVLSMPTISTRKMTTSILTKSGQTIVLGGIYENSVASGEDRLPFLSSIPGLGWLFKLQKKQVSKRELLVFVTPTIVDDIL